MLQITPILSDHVTVQQYLEAETQQQIQCIKVRVCEFLFQD